MKTMSGLFMPCGCHIPPNPSRRRSRIPNSLPVERELCTRLLTDTFEVWINFTNFVQLSMPIDGVTPSMLLEAWSSGFAIQCAFD